MVYVVSNLGKPLMPTERYGKVRRLLRDGLAKVIRRTPFTIQLTYEVPDIVQPIILGVDSGYKYVGLSATTNEKELFSAECQLRSDVSFNIATKAQFRRARRNRKTRYRKPRFLNRVKSKKVGWLPPSTIQKINSHIQLVKLVHKILPISKVILEVASFDIQKIKNPNIVGIEYQQGDQLGFWNIREYVLFRDGHCCQHCKGKSKDPILNVHHIESRKTGGDSPSNLITLCKICHEAYHNNQIKLKVKRGKVFKAEVFMGIMRRALYKRLKDLYDIDETFGYITKYNRIQSGLEKSHAIDARVISGNFNCKPLGILHKMKVVRTKNRSLHKAKILNGGRRKFNQSPKYVHGYQLYDKVKYLGKDWFIYGRRASGYFLLRDIDYSNKVEVSPRKLQLLEKRVSILIV